MCRAVAEDSVPVDFSELKQQPKTPVFNVCVYGYRCGCLWRWRLEASGFRDPYQKVQYLEFRPTLHLTSSILAPHGPLSTSR